MSSPCINTLSWLSLGHASLAMCSAVFIMLYTWRRAPSAPPHLGRLFLIFLFLASAGAVCGSRVMVMIFSYLIMNLDSINNSLRSLSILFWFR